MSSFLAKSLSIVTVSFLVSSCSSFVLVSSEFEQKDATSFPVPEIVATNSYKRLINSVRTVAVEAPEVCADETAAQSSGGSSSEGTILKTSCGVEMALIERELAKAGYSVVSWSFLQSTVERTGQTTIDAAKSLGANVVLSLNSLERSGTEVGKQAQWSRKYFKSNAKGEQLSPTKVSAVQSSMLDNLAENVESILVTPDLERLSATVNSSVTSVESGETIWFYEWTLTEEQNNDISTDVLAKCKSDLCEQVFRTGDEQPANEDEEKFGSSSGQIAQSDTADNEINARHNELIKLLVKDMVSRFKVSSA